MTYLIPFAHIKRTQIDFLPLRRAQTLSKGAIKIFIDNIVFIISDDLEPPNIRLSQELTSSRDDREIIEA